MLLNGGTLDGVRILSPQSVETMLAPAWRYNGSNGARDGESDGICSYGLATRQLAVQPVRCADDPQGKGGRGLDMPARLMASAPGSGSTGRAALGIAYYVTGLPTNRRAEKPASPRPKNGPSAAPRAPGALAAT
jgi:hypothetical protein